jgi:hypothetical protein
VTGDDGFDAYFLRNYGRLVAELHSIVGSQVLAVAHDKAAAVTGRRERGGHAASTAAADRALSGFAADTGQ